MAFTNTPDFEDDFRKVGQDATAGFAPAGVSSNPTEHASSENLEVAGAADLDEDEDLEDDDDLEEADDEEEEDDDLEDEDEDDEDLDDEEDADVEEDDEDEEADLDDEEDDDDEEDGEGVKTRLAAAEKRVRAA